MTPPDLNWDAMLNMTKVEFELVSDANKFLFFEKSTRGRVSCISKDYRQANNTYLKSYDPKPELKHIIYLDGKNLMVMQCPNVFKRAGSNGWFLSILT